MERPQRARSQGRCVSALRPTKCHTVLLQFASVREEVLQWDCKHPFLYYGWSLSAGHYEASLER